MAAASLRRFAVATLPSSTSLTSGRGGQRRGSLEFSPNRRQDDGEEVGKVWKLGATPSEGSFIRNLILTCCVALCVWLLLHLGVGWLVS